MLHRIQCLLLLGPLLLAGCPVTQPQDTPVSQQLVTEPSTRREYWLYVPSGYSADRAWPLVITLHGTNFWDTGSAQIKEWKALAEEYGFIAVAPKLRGYSTQGILPVPHSWRMDDLREDEQFILALLDDLAGRYNLDRSKVLLTGFSAGGFPLYYVGLRNHERFSMLVARACNSDVRVFESIELTEEMRKLPIFIYWGRDDLGRINDQSWQAFAWLRRHKFYQTERRLTEGGHLRQPEVGLKHWMGCLDKRSK